MIRSFLAIALISIPALVQAEPVSFKRDIAPVLLNNCLACHGPKKAEGSYRIDTFERTIAAGDSTQPGYTPKDLDGSEAYRRIVSTDPAERMPLDGDPLPPEQVELMKRWIEEGANFDGPDPKAPLASYIPAPTHPAAPEKYNAIMPVTAMAFSPDGSQLYVGGYHEITVWNPADGSLIKRIANVGQRSYAIVFRPDGKQFAVACGAPGRHGEVRLFNAETGSLENVIGMTSDVVFDVAYNPAGDRLATAAADSTVRIFEVATGAEQKTISSHSDWVFAVAWSPDGTKLATASRDKTAKAFDASSGDLLITYSGHNQSVRGVMFHPDGAEVYSSGSDNKVHRWKVADGNRSSEFNLGGEAYQLIPAGEFFLTTSAEKKVRQYKAKEQQQVREFPVVSDWTLTAAYHAGAKRIAAGTFDGQVFVWNADDGSQVAAFHAAPGYTPPEKK